MALSSAEAELYAMVSASAEALAAIAYARDLGMVLQGEVYTDSSAALGISQRAGIGKVRHLRTQGLWVQECRVTGRLSYHKVLGAKNPADVLTKHVAGDLLDRHLGTIGAQITSGRAESAPEISSLESLVRRVEWDEPLRDGSGGQARKNVRFEATVRYRAIESCNRGKRCRDAAGRSSERKRREEHRGQVGRHDFAGGDLAKIVVVEKSSGANSAPTSCPECGDHQVDKWADVCGDNEDEVQCTACAAAGRLFRLRPAAHGISSLEVDDGIRSLSFPSGAVGKFCRSRFIGDVP